MTRVWDDKLPSKIYVIFQLLIIKIRVTILRS